MWTDFVNYCKKRTTFLRDFTLSYFKAEKESYLPYFLYKWQQSKSILESVIYVEKHLRTYENENIPEISSDTLDIVKDYINDWDKNSTILRYLRDLFPDMMLSNYNIKNLEKDVENFSPRAIEEFWKITKGKYYLGQDLDEDLKTVNMYIKDQVLLEENESYIFMYFNFRYEHYDLSLLGEYTSVPFGIHESRALNYKKTKNIEFDYPREYYKYPVKDIVDKYSYPELLGTRIINIRGTNGSGKTTMVSQIYADSVAKGCWVEKDFNLVDAKGKSHKRYYDVLSDKQVILLGGYNSPFGTKGTDRLGDVYEIIDGLLYLVRNYPKWTIIMESATVSTSFWSYAILFALLKAKGVETIIISLIMKDWNFPVNNVKSRTTRKEGAKEPNYKEIVDKREILYKNHFRFANIIGIENCMFMYPDLCKKEDMSLKLNEILVKNGKLGVL